MYFLPGGGRNGARFAARFRHWRSLWTASDAVRFAVAAILFTAAVLKTHQLATEPVLGIGLLESRWFLTGVVQFEILLGFWLISGVAIRWAWWTAVATFLLFAFVAIAKPLAGDATRDGLARVLTGSWAVLSVDLLVLLGLCCFRPRFRFVSSDVSGEDPRRLSLPTHWVVSSGQVATRHAWIVGAWLTTAVFLGAISEATKANNPSGDWPIASERHRKFDLLLCGGDGTAHVTFPLRNTSTRTWHVLDVLRSCGCTRTQLGRREFAPGECSHLTVSIEVSNQDHQRTVSCTLVTDDEAEPRKTFVASVRAVRPAQFDTHALDFGEVTPGMWTSGLVTLTTAAVDGAVPARVSDVKGSSSPLVCTVLTDHVKPGAGVGLTTREVKLRVDFLPPGAKPFDGLAVVARIESTGQPTVLELPVCWRVKEMFSVSPPRLLFTLPARSTEASRRTVIVKRRDGLTFRVQRAYSLDSATIVRFRSASEVDSAALEIEIMQERVVAKRYACAVVVETDCALQRLIVVPVVAMVDGSDDTDGML